MLVLVLVLMLMFMLMLVMIAHGAMIHGIFLYEMVTGMYRLEPRLANPVTYIYNYCAINLFLSLKADHDLAPYVRFPCQCISLSR